MKTYNIPEEGVFEEMLANARDDIIEIRTDEPLICADFLQRFIRAVDDEVDKITCTVTKAQSRIYMFIRIRLIEEAGTGDGD